MVGAIEIEGKRGKQEQKQDGGYEKGMGVICILNKSAVTTLIVEYLDLHSTSSLTLVETSMRQLILTHSHLACWQRLSAQTFFSFPWLNKEMLDKHGFLWFFKAEMSLFSASNALRISLMYPWIIDADLSKCEGFNYDRLKNFVQNCNNLIVLKSPQKMVKDEGLKLHDCFNSAVLLEKLEVPDSLGINLLALPRLKYLKIKFLVLSSCHLLCAAISNCMDLTEVIVSESDFSLADQQALTKELSEVMKSRTMRINFTGTEIIGPIKIACGICSCPLYDSLQSYILTRPRPQPFCFWHEIHTFTPPREEKNCQAQISRIPENDRLLACRNGCQMETKMVENYGFDYSIPIFDVIWGEVIIPINDFTYELTTS